jgi:DNA-binding MarR family transcriptional regulator
MKADEEDVLRHLQEKPGSTARDIARELFGGTGDTRTMERSKAHRILSKLERDGKVWGSRDDEDSAVARRWYLDDGELRL